MALGAAGAAAPARNARSGRTASNIHGNIISPADGRGRRSGMDSERLLRMRTAA